jgi:hypothetical protein
LAEDRVQPIIFYTRLSTCWQPWVKGFTIMVNSLFNGWRMEDVWLDKIAILGFRLSDPTEQGPGASL